MTEPLDPKNPNQPIVQDEHGTMRFKTNTVVRFLLDAGEFDLNYLALIPFSADDRNQFYQQIGYSVSGFGDLDFADHERVKWADEVVDRMRTQPEPATADSEERAGRAACADCRLPYKQHGPDSHLSVEQWVMIGGGDRVICPACIFKRAKQLPRIEYIDLRFVFGPEETVTPLDSPARKAAELVPPGNWHAIEGPNGRCACGPVEACGDRLASHVRGVLDLYETKANYLEREREAILNELPDVWRRRAGSLAYKVGAMLEFLRDSPARPTPDPSVHAARIAAERIANRSYPWIAKYAEGYITEAYAPLEAELQRLSKELAGCQGASRTLATKVIELRQRDADDNATQFRLADELAKANERIDRLHEIVPCCNRWPHSNDVMCGTGWLLSGTTISAEVMKWKESHDRVATLEQDREVLRREVEQLRAYRPVGHEFDWVTGDYPAQSIGSADAPKPPLPNVDLHARCLPRTITPEVWDQVASIVCRNKAREYTCYPDDEDRKEADRILQLLGLTVRRVTSCGSFIASDFPVDESQNTGGGK